MKTLEEIIESPSSSNTKPTLKITKKKIKRTEKKFYQKIRTNLWRLPEWDVLKLDTYATRGIPDLLVRCPEYHFHFIELKITSTRSIRLSPHQVSFLQKNKDTRSWIMVEDATDSIYLYHASQVLDIKKEGLSVQPLGGFFEYPYIDWEKIFNSLRK